MNQSFKRKPLAVAIMMALSAPVLAQQVLPEVTVKGAQEGLRTESSSVGTKTNTPLKEIPQAVTVVPEKLITSQGALSLRDALRNVSGLTIAAGEGGRTGDSITLRGFAAHSDTYQDGVKDNGQYFRDTFNVERVEVLKGPSSVLFGRGATGGVINSVTKKPTRTPAMEASVTVGSYDLKRITADINQPVSDTVGLRVNAFYHDANSFRDYNYVERSGIAPAASFKISDQTRLHVYGLHQEENSTLDYGIPMYRGKPADVSIKTNYGFPQDSFQKYDVNYGTVALDHKFNADLSVRNTFRLANYERNYRVATFGTVTDTGPTSTVTRSQSLRLNDQDNIYNQTDFIYNTKTGDINHTLLFGLEVGREEYDFKSKNTTGTVPAVSIFNPVTTLSVAGVATDFSGTLATNNFTKANTTALYVQDQIDLTQQWKTVLGARWDRFQADFTNRLTGANLKRTDTMISPRAGLIYQPTQAASYYANYSMSFNPSAETFSLSDATTNLDPEKNNLFEIGTKQDFLDGKLAVSAALYRLEKTNARTTDPLNAALQVLDGKQRTDGLEIDVAGTINPRWQVFGGFALMNAKVVKSNNVSSGISVEGKTPANTPEHSGSIWTTYQLTDGWEAGGGLFYVGKRYANTVETAQIPGYTRADVSLAYHQKRYDIQFNVFNVFDKTYYDNASGSGATPGAPRNAQLTARFKF